MEDTYIFAPNILHAIVNSDDLTNLNSTQVYMEYGITQDNRYDCHDIVFMGERGVPIGQGLLLSLASDEGHTGFSACCAFGGGYRWGKRLLMDTNADTHCFSQDGETDVLCKCGCTDCRYNVNTNTCVDIVPGGHRCAVLVSQQPDVWQRPLPRRNALKWP